MSGKVVDLGRFGYLGLDQSFIEGKQSMCS